MPYESIQFGVKILRYKLGSLFCVRSQVLFFSQRMVAKNKNANNTVVDKQTSIFRCLEICTK